MNRISYIDNIKTLGIFFIILGHMPLTNRFFHNWIFTFHVLLFFFISGFLCKYMSDNISFLKKNFYSLILVTVPYFIIGYVFRSFQNYFFYPNSFDMENVLWKPLLYYLTGDSRMGVMWFLLALFWMRIISNFVLHYLSIRILLLFSFILAIVLYCIPFHFNIYQIYAALLAFPIYCLGINCRRNNWIEQYRNLSLYIRMIISFILFILTMVCTLYCGTIDLNALKIGNNLICYYIAAIMGIFFIISLTCCLKTNKKIEIISQGTMVILGFHMFFIQVCKLGYKKLLGITIPPPYMDNLSGIILSLFILVICYFLIVKILNSKYKVIRLLAGKK